MGVIINAIPKKGSVSVTANGVKNRGTLFSELFALVDITKVSETTKFEEVRTTGVTIVYHILSLSASGMRFGNALVHATNSGTIENIYLSATSEDIAGNYTTNFSYNNRINEVPQSGYMFKVVY